jgi:RNA polymerase sigma factor (TIGR02999 family)
MAQASLPSSQPAQETLFALVYRELCRIARGQRRVSGNPATLNTTALVHEVYLKLHAAPEIGSIDRVHFLSLATRAMRQILIDHARSHGRAKRGSGYHVVTLHEDAGLTGDTVDLVALDDVLERLAQIDPRAGQLVEWRVFGGLEIAEIAQMQGVAERTVFRDWRRARAFLIRELGLAEQAST